MLLFEGPFPAVGFDSEDSTNATGKRFIPMTHIAIMLAISRVESPTNKQCTYALMDTFKYIQRKLSGNKKQGRVKPVTLVEMGGATEAADKNEDIVEIINTASTVKLNRSESMAEFVAGLETKLRSIKTVQIPLKGWNPKHPVLVYTFSKPFLHYFLKQRANIRIEKEDGQIIAADSIDVRMGVCGNDAIDETALPEITDLTFQRRLLVVTDKVYSELSQIAYHEDLSLKGLCLLPKPQRGNWSEYELLNLVLTPRMREYMTEYKHNISEKGTQGILSTKHLDFLRYGDLIYNLSEGTSPGHLASTSFRSAMTCKEMANQSICATCMGPWLRFEKGGYADLVGKPLVLDERAYKAMVGMRYRLEGDNFTYDDCGTTHAHRYTFKDTQIAEAEYASRKLQLAANVLMYISRLKESGATSRSHLYNTDKDSRVYTNQVWEGFFTGMHSVGTVKMNQVLQAFVRGKTSEIEKIFKDPALRYNPVVMSVLDYPTGYDEDGQDMVEEAYKLITMMEIYDHPNFELIRQWEVQDAFNMTVKNLLSYCTTIDFDRKAGVDLAETRYILSQHVYAGQVATDDLHLDFMSEAAVLAWGVSRLYPQVPTPSTMAYRPFDDGKSLEMSSRHIKLSWPYDLRMLNSDQVWKLRGRYYVT
ncbi:hypothetical protein SPFM15_00253 [Salmonella phage SPFM15]|nr:hypothetical protein SPFM5_00248 [Salmonella phage SPFM5]VFR13877.1 hypothetical protein SPFM15_00253 [Salmonella phage SPFM15]